MMQGEQTPSEYLMSRFDAIKKFEQDLIRRGRHPLGLVKRWYGNYGHLSQDPGPYNEITLRLCQDLEEVIGIEDGYWHEGSEPRVTRRIFD